MAMLLFCLEVMSGATEEGSGVEAFSLRTSLPSSEAILARAERDCSAHLTFLRTSAISAELPLVRCLASSSVIVEAFWQAKYLMTGCQSFLEMFSSSVGQLCRMSALIAQNMGCIFWYPLNRYTTRSEISSLGMLTLPSILLEVKPRMFKAFSVSTEISL